MLSSATSIGSTDVDRSGVDGRKPRRRETRRRGKRAAHDLHARRDLRAARHRGPPGRPTSRPTAAAVAGARAAGARFVLYAARGTSDNAAVFGKYLATIHAGLPAGLAVPSSATVYDAPIDLRECLVIGHQPERRDARRRRVRGPGARRPARARSPSPTTTTACWRGRPTPCWPRTPGASAPSPRPRPTRASSPCSRCSGRRGATTRRLLDALARRRARGHAGRPGARRSGSPRSPSGCASASACW